DFENYRNHNIQTALLYFIGFQAAPFRVSYDDDKSVVLTVPKTVEAILRHNDVMYLLQSLATHDTDVPARGGRIDKIVRETASKVIGWGLHLYEATQVFGCIPILFCFHSLKDW